MKHIFWLIALAIASSTYAQERSASGPTETQMTWSSLSSLISAADAKIVGANARIDQVVVCGKKGMVYAPNTSGADTEGCLQTATSSNVTNSINNLTTTDSNVLVCSRKLAFYAPGVTGADAQGCVTPSTGGQVESGMVSAASTWGGNSVNVTFSKPFKTVPKVSVSLAALQFSNTCGNDKFTVSVARQSITTTGFVLTSNGFVGGCDRIFVPTATWVAHE